MALNEFFNNITQGFNTKQKEDADKRRLQLLKEQNLSDKIQLDKTKTEAAIAKDQVAATQAQAQAKLTETQTLSTELDNKQKKVGLLGTLGQMISSAFNPASKGERAGARETAEKTMSGVKTASQADIDQQLATLPDPLPGGAQTEGTFAPPPLLRRPGAVGPPGAPQDLPPVTEVATEQPDQGLDLPLPPFMDTKGTKEALQEQQKAIERGNVLRNDLMEQEKIIRQSFLKAGNQYRMRMQKNMDLQRNLAENPPSYKKAVSNVGWFSGVLGILDAALHGDLHENPTQLLDELIEKEMQDQKMAHTAQAGFLKNQATMYQQFYNLNKDEVEAWNSTRAVLLKGIEGNINDYKALATTEEQMAKLDMVNQQIQYEHGMAEAKMEQKLKSDMATNAQNFFDLDYKKSRATIEREKAIGWEARDPEAKLLGLSPEKAQDKKVEIGGIRLYDIPIPVLKGKDGLHMNFINAETKIRTLKRVENLMGKIGFGRGVKAHLAHIPFTKVGKEARRNFEELNKTLTQLMLKARIDFTGGGNMNNAERQILTKYHEVLAEEGFFTKGAEFFTGGAYQKMARKMSRGDYQTLVNVLKKVNIDRTFAFLNASSKFIGFSQSKKNSIVAKRLGLSTKDVLNYFEGGNIKSWSPPKR